MADTEGKRRKRTDAMRRASARYDKARTRQVLMKLNVGTDADILEWLDSQENRQGYLKQIIRRDMALHGFVPREQDAREQDE